MSCLLNLGLLSRQVRSENKEKNAVMSFTVTDEPVFIDLTLSENKEEVSGLFYFYFLRICFWTSQILFLNQDFDDVMVQERE